MSPVKAQKKTKLYQYKKRRQNQPETYRPVTVQVATYD